MSRYFSKPVNREDGTADRPANTKADYTKADYQANTKADYQEAVKRNFPDADLDDSVPF